MGFRGTRPNPKNPASLKSTRDLKGKNPMATPVNRPSFVFKAKELVGLCPSPVPLGSGDPDPSSSTPETPPPQKAPVLHSKLLGIFLSPELRRPREPVWIFLF